MELLYQGAEFIIAKKFVEISLDIRIKTRMIINDNDKDL